MFLTDMSLTMESPHDLLAQLSARAAENMANREGEETNQQQENNNDQNEDSPSPDNTMTFDIEAQQKALQRLMGGLGNFRNPFPMNVLPPFLAALQQNPLALNQQLLGLGGMSGLSPRGDEDEDTENMGTTEPEDLTIGFSFRKEKKDSDDIHDVTQVGMGQPSWSYEEQFKQLYELSDDTKRKEWLDDWLGFMHRIGKPVTRIPIMAKQVLDLYELYRLVVQHGGLVEIINKKLWREITKGLNLPSSITSAAFTLRTQYQKYLYDYECEKEGLSTPSDLQSAIDGNRREGRRNPTGNSFGPLGYPLGPPPGASLLGKHPLNGLNLRNDFLDFMDEDPGLGVSQQNPLLAAYKMEQLAMFEAHQRQFQRAAAEAVARQNLGLAGLAAVAQSGRESTSSVDSDNHSAAKRARLQSEETQSQQPSASGTAIALPTTNIKITNNKDGENKSMVVSIEVNGTTYQGVLFALNNDGVDGKV